MMKLLFYAVTSLMFISWTASAAPATDPFQAAQTAYDEEHYTDAAALYSGMISNGVNNAELHYNLANAYFKNGNLPDAVWHYRKAWYQRPRDPDIKANLHFALSAAGVAEPAQSPMSKVAEQLSKDEWVWLATAGYIALFLLPIPFLLRRSALQILLKTALLPAFILLTAGAGWMHWKQLERNPEWVVIQSGATALFGPVEGSTAHYKLPLGALVKQTGNSNKEWIEISFDGKKGWLKTNDIKIIYP